MPLVLVDFDSGWPIVKFGKLFARSSDSQARRCPWAAA
jgi:hypothetical protein